MFSSTIIYKKSLDHQQFFKISKIFDKILIFIKITTKKKQAKKIISLLKNKSELKATKLSKNVIIIDSFKK